MGLQDQIAVDQQAVADAESALNAAHAQLAADQAALDAVQPHLSLLDKLETFAGTVADEARIDFLATIEAARKLLGM